jgi:signal transduction histidine kinase
VSESPAARRLLLLLCAACVVPAALDGAQTYLQAVLAGYPPSWPDVLWHAAEWLIFAALMPLAWLVGRRYPLRRPHVGRHLVPHLLAALVLCAGWATMGASLRWALDLDTPDRPRATQLASWLLTSLPWSVFMYFAVLGSVHAIFFFVEAQQREAQAARLEARLAEARLGALRMQLHPHFLFNSLNAVTVLVRDRETDAATRMLELIADVLRQVLRGDRGHEIPLGEELRFLRQYLAIEQVRFSDRLKVELAVDEALLDAAVPALVLQPLVENALRHGLAKTSEAGVLELGARREGDDLVLTVADDGPGPPPAGAVHAGVGLANVRERLGALYGGRGRLELTAAVPRGTVATVRLPFHESAPGVPPRERRDE